MNAPAADSGCVLLVDDDHDILYTLRLFLELDKHRVLTASTVNEALLVLDREPVDVVVTDLVLPGLSGLDLLTALRSAREDTEVVLVTGHADVGSAMDALRKRAFDYLHKPVTGSTMRGTVRRALEASRTRSSARRKEAEANARLAHLAVTVEARTAELRVSEDRYRTLIESLPVLILELDAATSRTTYEGGALVARLRHHFANSVPSPFVQALHPDDRTEFDALIRGGAHDDATLRLLRVGSETHGWLVLRAVSVRDDGEGRVACVLFDVTEQHRAEQAREKLERELEQARAEFEEKLLGALELDEGSRPHVVDRSPRRESSVGDAPFGISPAMRTVEELARLAAEHHQPVLILGETGTGKGVVARFVHDRSGRGPFVALNCSSLRGELLDSELFGHVRGAFTSAVKDRRGLVEEAAGGTLFLDEIGETSPETQARLLKLLEERTFRRVGETRERTSDFRLVCATNRDLAAEVSSGRFRRDLLYRINLFTIPLPPLRERVGDVPWLVQRILSSLGAEEVRVRAEAMRVLERHSFPGNVRELRNALIRATLLARGRPLGPEHLPELSHSEPSPTTTQSAADVHPPEATPGSEAPTVEGDERATIVALLKRFDGNRAKVARTLGMSRTTLYKKLHALGLATEG